MINNTVVLIIHTGHLFHHARLLHQNLSEDRSVRQLRAANFKVDLDQLSLPRKFDFHIIPTARYDLDLNLDHPLASIIMRPSFVLMVYLAGKRNLAAVARIVERLPRCSRNSLFANKKTAAPSLVPLDDSWPHHGMRLSFLNPWVGRPSRAVARRAGYRRRGGPFPLPGARASGRLKTQARRAAPPRGPPVSRTRG